MGEWRKGEEIVEQIESYANERGKNRSDDDEGRRGECIELVADHQVSITAFGERITVQVQAIYELETAAAGDVRADIGNEIHSRLKSMCPL